VINSYLGYSIIAIQKQLAGITVLIKEMSRKCAYVIDSTLCIIKASLCSGNNQVSEDILKQSCWTN
jgi:hypothetical protein